MFNLASQKFGLMLSLYIFHVSYYLLSQVEDLKQTAKRQAVTADSVCHFHCGIVDTGPKALTGL